MGHRGFEKIYAFIFGLVQNYKLGLGPVEPWVVHARITEARFRYIGKEMPSTIKLSKIKVRKWNQ